MCRKVFIRHSIHRRITMVHYIQAHEIRYNDLLAYIQYEKANHLNVATINLRLTSINKYLEYLKGIGELERNLARILRVKGELQKVVISPLNRVELDTLYQQYSQLKKVAHRQKQTDEVHNRNTVILGLLVFQGVHSGELQKMEVNHINLNAGTVYIPSTSQGESRELELAPKQVIALHHYLAAIRSHFKPKGDELIPGSIRNRANG